MRIIPVEDFDLVVFGATGDLATRKIFPSLFRRWQVGQIPPSARFIGAARKKMTSQEFRTEIAEKLEQFAPEAPKHKDAFEAFLASIEYIPIDAQGAEGWEELATLLRENVIRAFYLSLAPALFGRIAERLVSYGCANEGSRIVVEKPFGHDLASARDLNKSLRRAFLEEQIYRIDHYLGKETVQNLMAVRFANALFEPLWNARHIDHVQITVAEKIGVAGRGGYYDKSGAMRDMVQNHLMQLLCLIAMEPPAHFDANAIRDEKLKVIRALRPPLPAEIVRGQYRAGGGEPSYLDEVENPKSTSESFTALRVEVRNWRWRGTPFYLRTGKRLRAQLTEIAVMFRQPPHSIFGDQHLLPANSLIIHLQPDEGISFTMTIKEPGPGGMRMMQVPLDMTFAETLGENGEFPDAYERLIMDIIRGDQTLFMRGDEVEEAWAWIDQVIARFDETPPFAYDALGSGPEESLALMHSDGRRWREIK